MGNKKAPNMSALFYLIRNHYFCNSAIALAAMAEGNGI
jgi:hypothetical protein